MKLAEKKYDGCHVAYDFIDKLFVTILLIFLTPMGWFGILFVGLAIRVMRGL